MTENVVIVDAVRTAIGNFSGSLRGVSAVDLGATMVKSLVERNDLSSEQIDEVILGLPPFEYVAVQLFLEEIL